MYIVKFLNEDVNERNMSLTILGLDLFLNTIYRAGQLSYYSAKLLTRKNK